MQREVFEIDVNEIVSHPAVSQVIEAILKEKGAPIIGEFLFGVSDNVSSVTRHNDREKITFIFEMKKGT